MNSFEGIGFVGTRPELRTVAINGEERSELRIDASRGSDAVTLVLLFVDQVQATPRPGKPAGLDVANTGTDLESHADEESVPLEPVAIDGEDGEQQESVLAQSAGPTVTDAVTDGGTKKGGRRRAR